MTEDEKAAVVDPALLPLIKALASLAVSKERRETAEARSEILALRLELGLENDEPAWKARAEQLMEAFYDQVPDWASRQLRDRIRAVAAAVRDLGAQAAAQSIAFEAGRILRDERNEAL